MKKFKTLFVLIECLLPICSVKNRRKTILKDIKVFLDVHWGRPSSINCLLYFSYPVGKGIEIYCPNMDEEGNCTIISFPYKLKQENQLFINVESSTRVDLCKSGSNKTNYKKTFGVVAYYGNNYSTFLHQHNVGTIPLYSKPFHLSFYELHDQLNFKMTKNYKC